MYLLIMKIGCTAFRPDILLSFMEVFRDNILLLLHNIEESTSLVSQMVKTLPAMQDAQVRSLGGEDPLEKEMATRSSILA